MNTKLATRQIRLNEWAAIIKDCKASGQKVDIYCEQHGLSRDAYYYWLRKVKEAALTQAGFVELPALTSEQIPAKTIEKGTSAFETQMIIKINERKLVIRTDIQNAGNHTSCLMMLPASNTFTYVPDIRISEKELMD